MCQDARLEVTMAATRQELLAVVERSPERVAAHDRESWLALFGDDALVEDPVGSPPARKATGALGRFWDTFIAPHQIRFEVRRDHVVGREVFRDAIIHTRIGPHVAIEVPAYLLYQLDDGADGLQVSRMAAHWQLGRLSLGALKLGPRAWLPMTRLFGRMLRLMGLSWVGGYLASLWSGIGARGLRAAHELARALEARDAAALAALFVDDAATVELGATRLAPSALLSALPPPSRLEIAAPVTAGWTTSFRFRLDGPTPSEGLALLEFAPETRRTRRARLFPA
ncbi:MAG TPA: nuclear transport factor 2 family protein, partial [Polyangia bacterium]